MPAVNLTALNTQVAPSWVDDPSGRGTWGLLYSCTFTLSLCVWTSIHLNVPGPKESAWKLWRRKLKWLLVALFAPEAVVFTAFQQWLTAKLFLEELQKISDEKTSKDLEGGDGSQSKRKFDMTYAHYATMGGFAVHISHLHNTLDKGILTPNGLLFLADQGYFFELSPETIADKSKANLLAKGLVCLQVLWVAGQAIERKIAGYPISLLEFHTLVHVFCALVMYMLWIRKPYDINEPTMITDDIDEGALAFIVTSSRLNGNSGFQVSVEMTARMEKLVLPSSPDPWLHYYGALETSPQVRPTDSNEPIEHALKNMDDPRVMNHLVRTEARHIDNNSQEPNGAVGALILPDVEYYPAEKVLRHYSPANDIREDLVLESGQALSSGLGPKIHWKDGPSREVKGFRVGLSKKDIDRLDKAGAFIDGILSKNDRLPTVNFRRRPTDEVEGPKDDQPKVKPYPKDKPFDPFELYIINRHDRRLLCYREENMLGSDHLFDKLFDKFGRWGVLLFGLAMMIIPTGYGGIHLAAQNGMFPTPAERVLWQSSCYTLLGFASFLFISSLIVMGPLAASAMVFVLQEPQKLPNGTPVAEPRSENRTKSWGRILIATVIIGLMLSIFVCASTILYIGARVFIVVESFISLRHVPIGVYQTPTTNFMGYIPHL